MKGGVAVIAVSNFIPEIWARVILAALSKNLVFGGPGVSNQDYDGDIAGPGDTVKITSFSDPTVGTYTQGDDITWESPTDSGQSLNIDQQKYVAFTVDDVDRRQAAGDFQSYLEQRCGYVLAQTADAYIESQIRANAGSHVLNGSSDSTTASHGVDISPMTSGAPSNSLYLKVVLPASAALDNNLVPDDGNRFLVLPPFAQAALKATQAFMAFGYDDVLLTGQLGTIDNFNVFKSQNAYAVPSDSNGNTFAYAGHPMATTFAEQIVEMEALRLQNQFADGVRGLHVYGTAVLRPNALVVAGVNTPAGFAVTAV